MQTEVRICEVCGTLNEVNLSECKSCNDDLAYTPITTINKNDLVVNDSEEFNMLEKDKNNITEINSTTSVKKTVVLVSNTLINKNDGKQIEIPFTGALLGREGNLEVEYFEKFPYISNRHAMLEYNFDELFIMDIGSTNGTKVNGSRLSSGEKIKLNNGDIIQLANIEFIIS